jgi:PAS domain S-box-containing protein
MRKKRQPFRPLPSLRTLLLLLACACVVPMAALALALVGYEYHHTREEVEQITVHTAGGLMAAVDDRLQGTQRALLALAHSPASVTGRLDRMQVDAVLLQRAEQLDGVMLFDAQGRQVMNSTVPAGSALPAAPLPPLLDTLRERTPAVIDLFRSPVTGTFLTAVTVPVPTVGGNPAAEDAGALAATLATDALREVLLRQKLPPNWIAAVLDRSGTIVARTHEPARYVGTRARAELLSRIAQVPYDAVESTTVDGLPVVTAFSRSDRTGWAVAIGIPRSELASPGQRAIAVLLIGGALVLAATLALAWGLASRLHNSVEALGAAVRATGHRAKLKLPQPVFQEAVQLGQSFEHAHAATEDAHAALERKEARLRTILDTATDAIVTADANGRIVLFNRAAEAMFRMREENALGQPLESLVPSSLRGMHEQMRRHMGEGSARRMAAGRLVEGLRADGTTFQAQASISVADFGEGRLYTAILRSTAPPPAGDA